MALNAYYNNVRSKKFRDPTVVEADLNADMAELQDSPEYNPQMSDGVLAGV